MAALADQFSAHTASPADAAAAIGPQWFYALFRAGLPTDEAILYRADADIVKTIWTQSIARAVISGTACSILSYLADGQQKSTGVSRMPWLMSSV